MTDDGTIKTTANGVTYQYSATDNKWKIISGTANTIRSSGTTFPADPVDTQLFYRSDLEALFYYSTTATAWIQVNGGGFGPEVETASITDNSTTKVPCSNLVHDGLATKVALSGDETIAGVKTFSSFPITPSSAPSTDYQVANKKYVDAKVVALSATQSSWDFTNSINSSSSATIDMSALVPAGATGVFLHITAVWSVAQNARLYVYGDSNNQGVRCIRVTNMGAGYDSVMNSWIKCDADRKVYVTTTYFTGTCSYYIGVMGYTK